MEFLISTVFHTQYPAIHQNYHLSFLNQIIAPGFLLPERTSQLWLKMHLFGFQVGGFPATLAVYRVQ